MDCSICDGLIDDHRSPVTGEIYWTQGHNADPVTDGRCCTSCNESVVLPARIQHMIHGERYVEEAVERLLNDASYGPFMPWMSRVITVGEAEGGE